VKIHKETTLNIDSEINNKNRTVKLAQGLWGYCGRGRVKEGD
jgi:hypothetical protein